ncbi:MAG: hypothetical protein H6Q00_3428, partial [Holophagaceae bacterium]|nr:hypothetical protein [Holophagaceae bacterium]
PVPAQGGYALLLADPQPTTPSEALVGEPLVGFPEENWRKDLVCTTTPAPQTLSTVEAIHGARMEPRMTLAFRGGLAVPSGTPLQADVVESYTLLDQRVIEPESFSQDLWAHRWSLLVRDGLPVLESAPDALLVRLPLRMSRTFGEDELVEGRLWVGFYHDQLRLAETGSGLLGSEGGEVSNGGVTVQVPAGALTGTALLTVTPDSGDLASLWGNLGLPGALKASFSVDVVGTLSQGLQISLDALDVPEGAKPLLIQRRAVHGERVNLVVGSLQKEGSLWKVVPTQPLLEGGAFAVFLPEQTYAWVSGTTTDGASQPLADVQVRGDLLPALSGSTGAFSVPMGIAGTLRGDRSDMGLAGTLSVTPPATGIVLPLATVPFRILQVLPMESAVVEVGEVLQVSTSSPMAAEATAAAHLYRSSDALEIALRRTLSQDARTLLLVPESPLEAGQSYRLSLDALRSVQGETLPLFERRFSTTAQVKGDVDLTRFQLNYPDDQLNVTVTIPEGAVPAWSVVSVEATNMGAYGQGVMPPSGVLAFPMKANLGERLHVIVQTRDGRSVSGTIGRYVASDGRTTLGADGGRVEGPDGLAVVLPEGALSAPAEFTIMPMTVLPQVASGALAEGEQINPGLTLRIKGAATLLKQPIVEIPANRLGRPLDPVPADRDLMGNGPLCLFRTEQTTLPDGTVDEYHILTDTLQPSKDGTKLVSLGGLRLPDATLGSAVQVQSLKVQSRTVTSSAQADPVPSGIAKNAMFALDFDGGASVINEINFSILQSTYYYHSGTVYRNWNGSGGCGGGASATCYGPLAGAEVHRYSGTAGLDAARKGRLARGRLLAVADDQGRYMSVGGPESGAIGGQTWIALFAVDPRTGETSIDEGSPSAESLGLPWVRRNHSLAITSKGGNPFDPTLTAPRIRARMVDSTGSARSLFAVGDKATLQLTTDPGSQSVVRGKLTGSISQDFGTLPLDVPVTFGTEGAWHVDILGWSAKPVQGAASLDVVVTSAGNLGPGMPGSPLVIAKEPGDGDVDVEPSSVIKITFNEPVRGATSISFDVKVNDASVAFQVISGGKEVTDAATLVQDVWLVPKQRLSLGARVSVTVNGFVTDQDGLAFTRLSWQFTVRGAKEIGSLAGVGTLTKMVSHKGMLYAFETVRTSVGSEFDVGGVPIQAIRIFDVGDPSQPQSKNSFGAHGSWDPKGPLNAGGWSDGEPFSRHELNGLRVAEGVSIAGQSRDLLLVSSRPRQASEMYVWSSDGDNWYRSRHNTIWVYDITGDEASFGENNTPKLLLVSSLGTLSNAWAKGLGSAGGVLGCIKLRGGLSLWDANAWRDGYLGDAQALEADGTAFNGIQVLARRARMSTGYFPD